jgi:hypothetical protein
MKPEKILNILKILNKYCNKFEYYQISMFNDRPPALDSVSYLMDAGIAEEWESFYESIKSYKDGYGKVLEHLRNVYNNIKKHVDTSLPYNEVVSFFSNYDNNGRTFSYLGRKGSLITFRDLAACIKGTDGKSAKDIPGYLYQLDKEYNEEVRPVLEFLECIEEIERVLAE